MVRRVNTRQRLRSAQSWLGGLIVQSRTLLDPFSGAGESLRDCQLYNITNILDQQTIDVEVVYNAHCRCTIHQVAKWRLRENDRDVQTIYKHKSHIICNRVSTLAM
jgi:hypothetical protein